MALTINTNVAALTAHLNMSKTDSATTSSLERLSTGLRINKAADDASGMAIADSLKSQGAGLGQAIQNANDGISIVQTADGALEEVTDILTTIQTKAIQAAQDGQTYESRQIIQTDIDKLLEEVDLIASSTSFNGKSLLSGEFTNKSFQVGASSGQTVGINIQSADTSKNGHVTTANLTVSDEGNLALSIYSDEAGEDIQLQAVNMQYNNSAENGIGALADVINAMSDATGVSAQAVVESATNGSIQAGETGDDFTINGVSIGAVTVSASDSDGALVSAINSNTNETGVTAAVNQGILTLSTSDGRGIEVGGALQDVLGQSSSSMSTFGELRITQAGANELQITDSDSGTLTTNDLTTTGTLDATSDMLIAKGSVLAAGGTLTAGTTVGYDLVAGNATTTNIDSELTAGSVLNATTLEEGTTFGGNFTVATTALTDSSLLSSGSTLASGTTLGEGTLLTSDISSGGVTISAGSTLTADTIIDAAVVLTEDMTVAKDSNIGVGSILAAGSLVNDDITVSAGTVTQDMTLKAGSNLGATDIMAAGSTLGASFDSIAVAATAFTQDMELAAGSTLAAAATLEAGSTIGGSTAVGTTALTESMAMSAGSSITTGSTIAKGTFLTNDIVTTTGTIKAGTTLEQDVTTAGTNYLTEDMTLAKDSSLGTGSVFGSAGGGTASDISIEDSTVTRLQDIDVTTQEGAQIAISVAEAALKDYNAIRSNLGSTQNQLTSTISNISVTQINVASAESAIRDVDFADESQNYSKLQILAQSGSYAMAQANSASQTVLSLLQ